jgi:hypothetical protein
MSAEELHQANPPEVTHPNRVPPALHEPGGRPPHTDTTPPTSTQGKT